MASSAEISQKNNNLNQLCACNHEWHFYVISGEKTIVTIVDARTYDTGNGKNYRVVGKVKGKTGKKVAILLAIEA